MILAFVSIGEIWALLFGGVNALGKWNELHYVFSINSATVPFGLQGWWDMIRFMIAERRHPLCSLLEVGFSWAYSFIRWGAVSGGFCGAAFSDMFAFPLLGLETWRRCS